MSLPYENATSGDRALDEIRKILTKFGCQRFGTMTDNDIGELIVQFTYRERNVSIRVNYKGYAKAWLDEHPYSYRIKGSKERHEARGLDQAQISVCSIVRDWIKGQITAVEVGILSFEGAFLGQIMLPSGKTVLEHIEKNELLQLSAP